MSLRAFKLPDDMDTLIELIPPSFQYPENEAWNVQADEVESLVDQISGLRKVWLLFRLLQLVAPPLRDILRGFVWEEDGQPVGLTNTTRKGATDQWEIGNVSVLPEYRRRGIAHQLLQAAVDDVRNRGGKMVTLDVIDGNVPAYSLYTKLGFEHFSGQAVLHYQANGPIPECILPEGYTFEPQALFDWPPRYELARRITPDVVQRYSPVEERRFRQPLFVRLLAPVLFKAFGTRPYRFIARRGQVVATAIIDARQRKGGVNRMDVTLDPGDAVLAPYLVRTLVRKVEEWSPGRRTEFFVKHWQEPVITAALDAGFEKVVDTHTLGMIL